VHLQEHAEHEQRQHTSPQPGHEPLQFVRTARAILSRIDRDASKVGELDDAMLNAGLSYFLPAHEVIRLLLIRGEGNLSPFGPSGLLKTCNCSQLQCRIDSYYQSKDPRWPSLFFHRS
jgi:hypothetical protein